MVSHTIFNERPECQDRLIKVLEKLGFKYVSRSEAEEKRGKLSNVLFEDELVKFLNMQTYKYKNNNYRFSGESISKAVRAIDVSLVQGLAMASKEIYNLLTLGISVEERITIDKDSPCVQSFDLHYIDFDHPENNIWQVTEEFSVERTNGQYARPDIVLLVNGIPLVVIECKKSSVDIKEGIKQNVRNMMPDYIQQLFKFSQLVFAVNPNSVKYGTSGTGADFFVEWREDKDTISWQKGICEKVSPDGQILEQDRITVSMLSQKRFLDIIQNFIIFDSNIKKVARHQQFFAVKHAMDRINGVDNSDSDGGVIWHTQGSGKSLTMVMLVKKIMKEKATDNPRFIIVTDRIDLDKQIKDNFANTAMNPSRAGTGKGLKALLQDKSKVIITTLINKFETVIKNKYIEKSSDNIYVLIDEAHRSNYGGMYNYMKEVLPNSKMIAFTGTPLIAKKDKNTYKQFGDPIHSYTMRSAIEDGITVPLVYEGRRVVQNDPTKTIDTYFDSLTDGLSEDQKKVLKEKYSRFKKLAEASSRLNLIGFDICDHFRNYCLPKGLKAMVVCSSRASAVEMFEIIKQNGNDDIHPAVCISFGDKDEDENDITTNALKKIREYHKKYVEPLFAGNDEQYDESITGRFKNPEGDINLLIVKDKLLTGFDAPVAGVLYIDKPIQQHSLLQAIARVNRVYKNKDFGLIVDYWGIFGKLNQAIDMYDDAESGFNEFNKEDIEDAIFGPVDEKNKLEEAYKKIEEMFSLSKNATSNEWQESLKNEETRKEFYENLKAFEKLLFLALSNRSIFKEVGYNKIEFYKDKWLFYKKLRDAVACRYDPVEDFGKYEDGMKNLINTFVNATDVVTVVNPVSIGDEKGMKDVLNGLDSKEAKADFIKTRVEAKLKQVRYDDPLLYEEFSKKIKRTLEEYEVSRNADAYLTQMENLADDFRQGFLSKDYPSIIQSDSDSKAFYGAILNNLRDKKIDCDLQAEEKIAEVSINIKKIIFDITKRDWKHNENVHKQIHRKLDDSLFDLFEDLGLNTNNESVVEIIDLIEDDIMKAAILRY